MKNFAGRQGFPIIAALIFYILTGVTALCLFSFSPGGPRLPWQAVPAQSNSLYDIRPQLNVASNQSPSVEDESDGTPGYASEEAYEEISGEAVTPSERDTEKARYFSFTTTNQFSSLNVRKQPDTDGEIICRLSPGSFGYVLERGESWSLIQTSEGTGYAYNEYLEFQEISEEEYLAAQP